MKTVVISLIFFFSSLSFAAHDSYAKPLAERSLSLEASLDPTSVQAKLYHLIRENASDPLVESVSRGAEYWVRDRTNKSYGFALVVMASHRPEIGYSITFRVYEDYRIAEWRRYEGEELDFNRLARTQKNGGAYLIKADNGPSEYVLPFLKKIMRKSFEKSSRSVVEDAVTGLKLSDGNITLTVHDSGSVQILIE